MISYLKTNKKIIAKICIYVWVVMFFCAGTSVLINYMSTDSSVFFMMGRGMLHGKVLYKELFDHKGWYVYAFNYLGALLSENTSWGIWIVECIFMSINALLAYRCLEVMGLREKQREYGSILFVCVLLNYFTYQGGNFTETYAITFQIISFYILLLYYKNGSTDNPYYMLVHGLCVSIVACMKVNVAFCWIPVPFVILFTLLKRRDYYGILKNIAAGCCGVALGISPLVIYGIKNKCMADIWEQMVQFNLVYTSGGNRIFERLKYSILYSKLAWVCILLLVFSTIVIVRSKICLEAKILFIASWFCECVAVGISGRNYGHYYESLMVFLLPLVYWIVNNINLIKIKHILVWGAVFLLTIVINLRFPIKILGTSLSSRYVSMAEKCRSKQKQLHLENASTIVLNNNALFYNKLQVMPNEKYFYTPSISYETFPDAIDAQINAVVNKKDDIVVVVYQDYSNDVIFQNSVDESGIKQSLHDNYTMVEQNKEIGIEMYVLNECVL